MDSPVTPAPAVTDENPLEAIAAEQAAAAQAPAPAPAAATPPPQGAIMDVVAAPPAPAPAPPLETVEVESDPTPEPAAANEKHSPLPTLNTKAEQAAIAQTAQLKAAKTSTPGVGLAIAATTFIVITLSVLAVLAYLNQA